MCAGKGWGSTDPPAVWYRYSPSWHGRYPQRHLSDFSGKLQVDGYAGFDALFVSPSPTKTARVMEIACFAHLRRKFFDLYAAQNSPVAQEALERIRLLYEIETAIRGESAAERLAQRQKHAVPLLASLHEWMIATAARGDKESALAKAFNYGFNHWAALQRYAEDGHLEIDNNTAERSVRGIAVGKKQLSVLWVRHGRGAGGDHVLDDRDL